MKWRVEVKNIGANVRLLRDVLEGLAYGLVEDGNKHFLTSEEFEALNAAEDVHALASRVSTVVGEVGKNNSDLDLRLEIGDVWEINNGKSSRKYAFSSMLSTVHATTAVARLV